MPHVLVPGRSSRRQRFDRQGAEIPGCRAGARYPFLPCCRETGLRVLSGVDRSNATRTPHMDRPEERAPGGLSRLADRSSAPYAARCPAHPYTQLLAAAALDPTMSRAKLAASRRARQAARTGAKANRHGVTAGDGCRFLGRCPHAMDICATRPPDVTVGPGHSALCWLHDRAGTGAPPGPDQQTGR
jgi:oligopeptide/dipeptide ABC transporter ATP-binding protein